MRLNKELVLVLLIVAVTVAVTAKANAEIMTVAVVLGTELVQEARVRGRRVHIAMLIRAEGGAEARGGTVTIAAVVVVDSVVEIA